MLLRAHAAQVHDHKLHGVSQDSKGFTPLMRLLQAPSSSPDRDVCAATVLTLLARDGCDWAVGTQEPAGGLNALLLACGWQRPHLPLVAALAAVGGPGTVDVQTHPEGLTPLMLAVQANNHPLACLLLQHTRQVSSSYA